MARRERKSGEEENLRGRERERGVRVVRRCICEKKFQEKDFFFSFSWNDFMG